MGAVCPECAKPVYTSLLADPLRFADPQWLKELYQGLALTAWFFALGLVDKLLAPILMLPGGFVLYRAVATSTVRWIVSMGSMTLWCAGLVLLASANPWHANDAHDCRRRFWLRVLGIAALVGAFVQAAYVPAVNWFLGSAKTATGEYPDYTWPPVFMTFYYLVISRLGICIPLGSLLLALHLRRTKGLMKGVGGLLVVLAIVSGLHAAVELVRLPVSSAHAPSIFAGSGLSSAAFEILSFIVWGASCLLSLGFSTLGLAAALRTRRVVSQATRRQP